MECQNGSPLDNSLEEWFTRGLSPLYRNHFVALRILIRSPQVFNYMDRFYLVI